MRLDGETLIEGEASAESVALDDPLSFWGGFDAGSGKVIDRRHPQLGVTLSGRVVVMAAARGSSSGSSVLAEAIRLGTAPAAIILNARDGILIVGALAARELYGRSIPIIRVAPPEHATLRSARRITVSAGADGARIAWE